MRQPSFSSGLCLPHTVPGRGGVIVCFTVSETLRIFTVRLWRTVLFHPFYRSRFEPWQSLTSLLSLHYIRACCSDTVWRISICSPFSSDGSVTLWFIQFMERECSRSQKVRCHHGALTRGICHNIEQRLCKCVYLLFFVSCYLLYLYII